MAKPKPMRPVSKQADTLKDEVQNDAGKALKNSTNDEPTITKEIPSTEVTLFKKSQVDEGIATIAKLLGSLRGEKKKLFESEGEKISLQISGIKLPRVNDSQIIKIRLPHTPLPQSRDVCLIVKDLERGIKPDHEATVQHFQSLLADKGINSITQVISLRELKVEYKQFEAKTQLCQRFDLFLADARIIRLLPQFLGKPFYKRKKLPLQVDLYAKDLKAEIEKALYTVTLPLKHTGSCSSVSVGYSTLSKDRLLDNTLAVLKVLVDKYPGGWANVRSVHVKSLSTPSLPLYVTLRSSNELGKVESSVAHAGYRKTVSDELSTVPGSTVTVTPYGTVRVKRTADPDWDVDNEEPILEKEEKDEEMEKEKEKGKNNVKKQKKEKQKQEEKEDSESEDEIEYAELEYMKKVAEEEEEMEKSLETKIDKTEEKCSEVDSEAEKLCKNEDSEDEELSEEEDEDADDKEDAVNLLGDEENDSEAEFDSDDELNLQDADLRSDSEHKEEAPPKKNKTKKIEKSKSVKKKEKKEKKLGKSSSKKTLKQKKFSEKKKKEKQSPKSRKK